MGARRTGRTRITAKRCSAALLVSIALSACSREAPDPSAVEGDAVAPPPPPPAAAPSATEEPVEPDLSASPPQPPLPAPAPPPAPIGAPLADIPAGWPPAVPLPPGLRLGELPADLGPGASFDAAHEAEPERLAAWFLDNARAAGALPLGAEALGAARRVRLASGSERWMVALAPPPSPAVPGSAAGSSLRVTRLQDGEPRRNVPSDDGSYCLSALPPTDYAARTCVFAWEPPLEVEVVDDLTPAVAASDERLAAVFEDDGTLWLVSRTRRGDRGPVVFTESAVEPRVALGAESGWVLSWTSLASGHAEARYLRQGLGSRGRVLTLAETLWNPAGAWSPTVVRRRDELAALHVIRDEADADALAFRISGVKVDGTRVRRSGDMAILTEPLSPPRIADDGAEGLMVAWSAAGGIYVRPVGTDGLPSGPAVRVAEEPAPVVNIGYAAASYWVIASDEAGTRWWRVDPDGCLDDATGVLPGTLTDSDQAVFSDATGVYAVMQDCGGTALFRLEDDGAGGATVELGRIDPSSLPSAWAGTESGARGMALASDGSYRPARWQCE